MKKSVKTKKDLNRMALGAGATVTASSGQKFNASKKTAAPKPARAAPNIPPKAEPKPKPEPAPGPDPGSKLLAEKLDAIGRANVMMLAELKKEIATIKLEAAAPPTEWIFDMVRDKQGYLTRIKATAHTVHGRLN